MSDDFGNRMKMYEKNFVPTRAIPFIPVCVRLDGKAFHSFCRGLDKPYDIGMMEIMHEVTKELVKETNATIGYTQSDEITLILYSDNPKSQIYFDGKMQKITSVLASVATYFFNRLIPFMLPKKEGVPAFFDCRVWQVPIEEIVNVLLWREQDATKNSKSMAARSKFGHKLCLNKNGDELQNMLHNEGINWNDYPVHFKRGTYFQRRKHIRNFTQQELVFLPEKHEARKNPDLMVERSDIVQLDIPPMAQIENKLDLVLNGKEPRS